MDNIEVFIMVYMFLFITELINFNNDLIRKIIRFGTCIVSTLCVINILSIYELLYFPTLSIEQAKDNLIISLLLLVLFIIGYRYSNYAVRLNVEDEITPNKLKSILSLYDIYNSFWWVKYLSLFTFLYLKVLPIYKLNEWKVVGITSIYVFFVIVGICRLIKWTMDNNPVFEDVPKKILDEWLSREYYTDEEQILLRNRLIKLDIYSMTSY